MKRSPLAPQIPTLLEQGAAIEVTFYDTEFDEDEEEQWEESRDDFTMLFVGPTPAAIMQVQRDLLVQSGILPLFSGPFSFPLPAPSPALFLCYLRSNIVTRCCGKDCCREIWR